ncbi:MAG: TonB-dependent receptor, partial [Kangiellaceae bacterium]|nr:TonB-dependent receptor [Kangiellaceae bacterium]
YDGHALFDMPVNLIEQVEIIRGPGSALYGTNAVAGVINILTRRDSREIRLNFENHTGKGLHGGWHIADKDYQLNLLAGIEEQDSEASREYYPLKPTAELTSDLTNRYFEQTYLYATLEADQLRLNSFYFRRENGPWIGPLFDFGSGSEFKQSQWLISADYSFQIENNLAITPRLYFEEQESDNLNEDIVAGTTLLNNFFSESGLTKEKYKLQTQGLDLDIEYNPTESTRIYSGFSYQKQKLEDYDLSRNYQVIGFIPRTFFANHDNLTFDQLNKPRRVSALYSQAEFNFAPWFVTLGVRFDDYSDFGDSLNPRLALVYSASEQWKFKALFGSAFRAPTMRELYDNTRIGANGIIGNESLRPEESNTTEFGITYSSDAMIVQADIFRRHSKNVIEEFDRQGSGARGSMQNLGDIETIGGSIELIYQLKKSLRLIANVSRYRSTFDYLNNPIFDREILHLTTDGQDELFNQPRTRANLRLHWQGDKWKAFVSANYGGRLSHNNTTQLESLRHLQVDDYLQWNMGVSYFISRQLKFELSGFNLGERKFSDPTGGSNSDSLGAEGMVQPHENILFSLYYAFD